MKIIKSLLIMCVISMQVNAQTSTETTSSKWQMGLRVGGNLLPNQSDLDQTEFKLGLNSGITAAYKVNKWLSVKTELSFSQKGQGYVYSEKTSLLKTFNDLIGTVIDTSTLGSIAGYVDDNVNSNYKGYNKVGYLEIPVMAAFTCEKFTVSAGPYVGYVVKALNKEQLSQTSPLLDLISPAIDSLGFAAALVKGLINNAFPGYKQPVLTESTETNLFEQFNYGFVAQVGYQMERNLYLELRYSQALTNYLVADRGDNIKLKAITVSLHYSFNLKKQVR